MNFTTKADPTIPIRIPLTWPGGDLTTEDSLKTEPQISLTGL